MPSDQEGDPSLPPHTVTTLILLLKVFDDAYKSVLSCIVIDDIERLLGTCVRMLCRLTVSSFLQTMFLLVLVSPTLSYRLSLYR